MTSTILPASRCLSTSGSLKSCAETVTTVSPGGRGSRSLWGCGVGPGGGGDGAGSSRAAGAGGAGAGVVRGGHGDGAGSSGAAGTDVSGPPVPARVPGSGSGGPGASTAGFGGLRGARGGSRYRYPAGTAQASGGARARGGVAVPLPGSGAAATVPPQGGGCAGRRARARGQRTGGRRWTRPTRTRGTGARGTRTHRLCPVRPTGLFLTLSRKGGDDGADSSPASRRTGNRRLLAGGRTPEYHCHVRYSGVFSRIVGAGITTIPDAAARGSYQAGSFRGFPGQQTRTQPGSGLDAPQTRTRPAADPDSTRIASTAVTEPRHGRTAPPGGRHTATSAAPGPPQTPCGAARAVCPALPNSDRATGLSGRRGPHRWPALRSRTAPHRRADEPHEKPRTSGRADDAQGTALLATRGTTEHITSVIPAESSRHA